MLPSPVTPGIAIMPHLRLLTLGAPLLITTAGEVVKYRTRKHFALLIRLAIEAGRRLTRDHLIELLWSRASGNHGSHSLSQGITVLRNTIGRQFLHVQRTTVSLAEGVIDLDIHHLTDCTAEIRGRFLEGLDIKDAPGFEQWKDAWAARLYPQIRDCLVKRMDASRRVGDFTTVEKNAQILEDFDPLSEDAVRGIIEARAWVGDRNNALKAFTRFERRLVEELGAKPSPDLFRVAGLLREGRHALPRPTNNGSLVEERRFEPETIVGREREFSMLYDAWLEVRQLQPRIMVITGDPGIGKTTLANAFMSTAQMEGAVIARAQAYVAERELPFAVLAELVRQLALQRVIGGAEPEALAELTRLTPEVAAEFPGVRKPHDWAPEIIPLRLADAFLKAIAAAADDNPVVIVVDDIHAADNASVAILHMMARKLTGLRILLILAARSAEIRVATAPEALTSDASIQGLRSLSLEPLPPAVAGALVEKLAKSAPKSLQDPPIHRILRASAGNPLALELLTREWFELGEEPLLKQLEAIDTQPEPTIGIPPAIRAAFERQAQRLAPEECAVLDLAAVSGSRLGDLDLYEIVGCPPGTAAIHLSRLLNAGILREVGGQIEFRNELMRANAYYRVPLSVRQHLHLRIGEWLGSATRSDLVTDGLEVAWHFVRAGNAQRALRHAVAGAEVSIQTGAASEAEQILNVLIKGGVEGEYSIQAKILLARALMSQSKAAVAVPILESLLSENACSNSERAQIRLMSAAAEYLLNRDSGHSYREKAALALTASRETAEPSLLTQALFETARAGQEAGDDALVRASLAEIRRLLDDPVFSNQPMLHYACAFCENFLLDNRSALVHITRAIDILSHGSRLAELSLALTGRGVVQHYLCNLTPAVDSFIGALELAVRIGDDSRASAIASNLCTTLTNMGDYARAVDYGCRSVSWGTRAQDQPFLVAAHTNLVDPYFLTGQPGRAVECLERANDWLKSQRSWFARFTYLMESINLSLMLGNLDSAMEGIATLEQESPGRTLVIAQPGAVAKFRIFRKFHASDAQSALNLARTKCEAFPPTCPMGLLDAWAARAWAGKKVLGFNKADTLSGLLLLDSDSLRGKKALLRAQGFLE